MHGPDDIELRVDCPCCMVEGTRIETWVSGNACCARGVPQRVQCRLCGHAAVGSLIGTGADLALAAPARKFETEEDLEQALTLWAHEEGLSSARALVEAYFVLPTLSDVFDSMRRRERVETTFDVADYLFGGGAGRAADPGLVRDEEDRRTERAPRSSSMVAVGGPREELLALASIAASDGEANADDQIMLVRAAARRGLANLTPSEIRVWRPNELAPPATLVDRERVLEEMFQLAWSDGQLDDSEIRVIRDYARAWGIDPERVREWTELYSFAEKSSVARWLGRIALFLFPVR